MLDAVRDAAQVLQSSRRTQSQPITIRQFAKVAVRPWRQAVELCQVIPAGRRKQRLRRESRDDSRSHTANPDGAKEEAVSSLDCSQFFSPGASG